MEVVMEAMRMAGLALGLQALSSVALGESRPVDINDDIAFLTHGRPRARPPGAVLRGTR